MFYKKVSDLCKRNGIAMTTLAVTLGFSKSMVTNWKRTEATPRASTVKKIADYFGVSVDYFLEENNELVKTATPAAKPAPADEYTDEEKRLVGAYRVLPEGKRLFLLEMIEKFAAEERGGHGNKSNRA